MRYTQIDPVLVPWAKTHGLFVATQFKDEEVRSVQIVDDAGDSYGLWVDLPREDGSVTVAIAEHTAPSRKIRRQTFTTRIAELGQTLESAYAVAESWMHERGHTRTPVL
jgi:hypothetical protein